jgi:hypothetical protein
MITRSTSSIVMVLGLLFWVGCGNGSETPAGQTDAGVGNPDVLVGTFQVRLIPPVPASGAAAEVPGYTSVIGKVSDGPTPSLTIWEEAARDGDCRLLKPRVPFCSQSCGGSAACVEDSQCQAYPIAKSVGAVRVKGVKTSSDTADFSIDPVATGYQLPAGMTCPYPAFAEGDDITLESSGGAYAPFTLLANGISPLDLQKESLAIESQKPLSLTWTPPGQSGISTIYVKLDISHHGGTKGMIECTADDKGSLQISSSLLDKLIALGVAGFPTIVVTRHATGSTVISPGRVDLEISSEIEESVAVPGIVSCNSKEDCPEGQSCLTNLTCGKE